jgi:hypothetical protein
MKLFKVSGYLLEANAQTIENLDWMINRNFDTRQLHIEESMQFDSDDRLDDPNCDLAYLEDHFVHDDFDDTELFDRLIPKPGEKWKHFKEGKIVEIICVAEGTEYHELSVIYKVSGTIWSRPLNMFMSKTDKIKYPDSVQEYRFERVEE